MADQNVAKCGQEKKTKVEGEGENTKPRVRSAPDGSDNNDKNMWDQAQDLEMSVAELLANEDSPRPGSDISECPSDDLFSGCWTTDG